MYATLHTGDGARPTRAERAYRTLKGLLLAGDLPVGRRLTEERLAVMLDVSRTPVREALRRLSAEGLVVRAPEGGFRPAVPDLQTTAERYEVRLALELAALERGPDGPAHDRAAIAELLAEWDELAIADVETLTDPAFVLRDEDFHVRLAAAAGNRTLARVLVSVNEQIRAVRMHDFLTPERVHATIAEHRGIAGAVLAGDAPGAARRLRHHLLTSMSVVSERVALAVARMLAVPS